MGFSRQEYWSGLPFPSPGDHPRPLPAPGIKPGSPVLQADSLISEPTGKSSGWHKNEQVISQVVKWRFIESMLYDQNCATYVEGHNRNISHGGGFPHGPVAKPPSPKWAGVQSLVRELGLTRHNWKIPQAATKTQHSEINKQILF